MGGGIRMSVPEKIKNLINRGVYYSDARICAPTLFNQKDITN